MSTQEIEDRIRDTTHLVEAAGPAAELCSEPLLCSCGKFPILTEGSAALLNKCEACFSELQKDIGAGDNDDNGDGCVHSCDQQSTRATGSSLSEDPDDFPPDDFRGGEDSSVTEFDVQGALTLAMTDSLGSCTLRLNGEDETFKYHRDLINGSKARKLFKRASWDEMFRPLYWYFAFGALLTSSKVLITPCVVRLKGYGNVEVVLYAILETMCNRPRYDGLCINFETLEVLIVQEIPSAVKESFLDMPFDRPEMDR